MNGALGEDNWDKCEAEKGDREGNKAFRALSHKAVRDGIRIWCIYYLKVIHVNISYTPFLIKDNYIYLSCFRNVGFYNINNI